MKVSLKPHAVDTALYRTLSKIGDYYELKITVTPQKEKPFNIAIGFEEDDLSQFIAEAANLFGNYSEKVGMTASLLLTMLDTSLTELERKHKTGFPYWRRLRIRKRLVQTILNAAGENDPHKRRKMLAEEFFQASDKELLLKETTSE
jgi:hypothetical protein